MLLKKYEKWKVKTSVTKIKYEIQDLVKKKENISFELSTLLEKSSQSYNEFHHKNEELRSEVVENEGLIHKLSEKWIALN